MKVTLRYCETVSVSPSGGVLSSYIFRANGIFDPNYTGTGHQPMGRDTWATLYNHYLVTGSRVKVDYLTTVGGYYPVSFGVMTHDSGTVTATNPGTLIEQGLSTHKEVIIGSIANGPSLTLRHEFDASKFFGMKAGADMIYDLGAQVGQSPAEEAFFALWVGGLTGSDTLGTVNMCVTIDYDVVFTEPKEQIAS